MLIFVLAINAFDPSRTRRPRQGFNLTCALRHKLCSLQGVCDGRTIHVRVQFGGEVCSPVHICTQTRKRFETTLDPSRCVRVWSVRAYRIARQSVTRVQMPRALAQSEGEVPLLSNV